MADHLVRMRRIANQGLLASGPKESQPPWLPGDSGPTAPSTAVAAAVSRVVGVQAQETAAAALAVRARTVGLSEDDVTKAHEEARSVVRTWLMRGTLHLAATEDISWLLPLVGPRLAAAGAARRRRLGLDEHATERGLALLQACLADGPLPRSALVEQLRRAGLPAEGQAPFHLLQQAALLGLVCYGPRIGGQPAFVLLADWIDYRPTPVGDAALAELARRYLTGYGPAAPEDLAAWSGLPRTLARQAWSLLSGRMEQFREGGRVLWALPPPSEYGIRPTEQRGAASFSSVRLLGRYDAYLLGYSDRALLVDRKHARLLNAGGGIVKPAVLVAGRVEGVWGYEGSSRQRALRVRPFGPLSAQVFGRLRDETADIARFLGRPLELELDAPSAA
jgi:hypothetical protein